MYPSVMMVLLRPDISNNIIAIDTVEVEIKN